MTVEVGDRVATPDGFSGTVTRVERQAVPHGGPRMRVGIGPKRARPGEVEAALAELKLYAVVALDGKDARRTYDAALLAAGPEQASPVAAGPEQEDE